MFEPTIIDCDVVVVDAGTAGFAAPTPRPAPPATSLRWPTRAGSSR